MNGKIKTLIAAALVALTLGAAGCTSDADVASENLSKKAENFEILRRVVFYNGITGTCILTIEGFCSVETEENNKLTVTCKLGANEFKKHFLGRSDNVTWFAEQLESKGVSTDRYEVNFKPESIVPDIRKR